MPIISNTRWCLPIASGTASAEVEVEVEVTTYARVL